MSPPEQKCEKIDRNATTTSPGLPSSYPTAASFPSSQMIHSSIFSALYSEAKDIWHAHPAHHGTEEIPPPPPKKSMLDRARNSIARVAAQMRTGHWRSAVYLKRIRKRESDQCWLCEGLDRTPHRMSRAHVLLNCRNPRVVAARTEAWGERVREISGDC
jgi:hypothetical protein